MAGPGTHRHGTNGDERPRALVRARINYSAPRPGLDLALPGPAILEAILADGPIEVNAEGDAMRLSARFSASANARKAAVVMRSACTKARG